MTNNVIGIVGQVIVKNSSKAKFWASKHAPELLTAVGVAGFGGTIYLACKGTIKAQEVIAQAEENKALIETASTKDEYSEDDKNKDTLVVRVNTVKGFARCYAPAFICGTLTISCFLGSDYILRKRNIALVAAYNVLDDGFKNYRKNVIEKYGEEEDYKLNNNLKTEKISVTEIDEDGKKHKKKVDVNVLNGDVNGYTFLVDDKHSLMNVSNAVVARDQLRAAENDANRLLTGRGYITLNEVLRSIGLHETSVGQIVGWQTKGNGDGFVDFRMKQIRTEIDDEGVAFVLDFNVDGPIYQDIDKYTSMWGE